MAHLSLPYAYRGGPTSNGSDGWVILDWIRNQSISLGPLSSTIAPNGRFSGSGSEVCSRQRFHRRDNGLPSGARNIQLQTATSPQVSLSHLIMNFHFK